MQTGFFHTVLFWLREDAGQDDAAQLASGCRTLLTGIPGVLRLTVGVPAGTDRPVVDNSYSVALLLEFADAAAAAAYEDHPDHQRFIAEHGPRCRRVQVYDTLPWTGLA